MINIKSTIVLIIIMLSIHSLSAQKVSNREWTIFRKGINDYKAGKYTEAKQNFSMVVSKLPNSKLLTANYLMLAKSYYKMGDYQESEKTCDYFIRNFQISGYLDDIYYLQGNINYKLNRYESAIHYWLTAASKNQAVSSKALKQAEKTARFRLNERQLTNLKNNSTDPYLRHFYFYHLAEKFYDKGNIASALITLEEMRNSSLKNIVYPEEADRLYNILKNRKSNSLRIAALLPLSGENESVGKRVLDGANMAVDAFNKLPGIDLELVPYDYGTKLITAVRMLKEIALDRSIIAVFGPIENDITTACAAIAEYENIPLISPTSSENRLTELSPDIVQLATPVNVISENLVEYLADSLRNKRVATLSPIDQYFVELTDAFVNKCRDVNCEVAAEQWYYPGDKDFSKQYKKLRRISLKLAFQDSITAMDPTISAALIDSMYKNYVEEKKLLAEENNTKIDSLDIPITAFNAVFMPVFKEDIGLLAPQFAQYNVQSQILGNSDWYDPEALKNNKTYLNGLVFIADGYIDEENWDYRQFRNNFRTKYKRTPEQFDIVGYDCLNFIVKVISDNRVGIKRDNFIDTLVKSPKYNGIYRNIEIDFNRYNKSTRLLKYWHGLIMPLN